MRKNLGRGGKSWGDFSLSVFVIKFVGFLKNFIKIINFNDFLTKFSLFRTIAYDFESLQFIADFKTTAKDPTALYFVSSRFHRFFLKNLNPYEINTRIMRIGNVVQSSPSYQFSQPIQQYQQNHLVPFNLPNVQPTAPLYPQYSPYQYQGSSAAYPAPAVPKPNYSLYSFAQNFDSKPAYPMSPASNFFPLSQSPVRSYYKFRGQPTPYSYENVGVDPRNISPFQQLNAGESLPQPNPNFGEVYQPNRYARNPSHNTTSY